MAKHKNSKLDELTGVAEVWGNTNTSNNPKNVEKKIKDRRNNP
ncbi:hypothetical protein ACFSL6_18650 [Paenibacillus thailandensis]|uniref:Uncharacterized protein n=1 Tax=Paenibacillus thailandensis TaxID=393250 RepID=A0ABW5QRZ4_9BACL